MVPLLNMAGSPGDQAPTTLGRPSPKHRLFLPHMYPCPIKALC